jgi:hypothetical protein
MKSQNKEKEVQGYSSLDWVQYLGAIELVMMGIEREDNKKRSQTVESLMEFQWL